MTMLSARGQLTLLENKKAPCDQRRHVINQINSILNDVRKFEMNRK
jgi:hypothetical protein